MPTQLVRAPWATDTTQSRYDGFSLSHTFVPVLHTCFDALFHSACQLCTQSCTQTTLNTEHCHVWDEELTSKKIYHQPLIRCFAHPWYALEFGRADLAFGLVIIAGRNSVTSIHTLWGRLYIDHNQNQKHIMRNS